MEEMKEDTKGIMIQRRKICKKYINELDKGK